jgi:hypothetical protein
MPSGTLTLRIEPSRLEVVFFSFAVWSLMTAGLSDFPVPASLAKALKTTWDRLSGVLLV